jgi:hypothetical protein
MLPHTTLRLPHTTLRYTASPYTTLYPHYTSLHYPTLSYHTPAGSPLCEFFSTRVDIDQDGISKIHPVGEMNAFEQVRDVV